MGNCQSDASTNDQQRVIRHKNSLAISKISLSQTIQNDVGYLSDSGSMLFIDHHEKVRSERESIDEDNEARSRRHRRSQSQDYPQTCSLPVYQSLSPHLSVFGCRSEESKLDYGIFLSKFPEYRLTWMLDNLRKSDFSRLDKAEECYVDYMGAALYPESLIRLHSRFLSRSIMGNTHSTNNSSLLSSSKISEARQSILSFFDAPPGYVVIFTSNASSALKLVGESFPFVAGSAFVLGSDSHNSVHGIRQFATEKFADVCYIPSTPQGGFCLDEAKSIIHAHRPVSQHINPSLFALTAQSNISNTKNPLSVLSYASSLRYHTLLDAAALAPTSVFSLKTHPVDAMAVSFYKMFGYPTGVGALIAKEDFLTQLKRPWFSGGNVEVVQVPGSIVTRTKRLEEQFEDGTVNYLTFPAITDGLRFLSGYLPFLPLRLSCLLHYLVDSLQEIKHPNGAPLVDILSRPPGARLRRVGEQSETGFMISFLYLLPSGTPMPLSFIEHLANSQKISLRTGCMCNSGGAASLLGISNHMALLYPGALLADFEKQVGRELGVVRVSLGLGSAWEDVARVVRFSRGLANEEWRGWCWDRWAEESGVIGQAF